MMPCHSLTGSRHFKQPNGLERSEPNYPRGGVISCQSGNVVTEIILVRKVRKIAFALAVFESESLVGYTQRGETIATGKPRLKACGMIRIKLARRSRNTQLSRLGKGAD